MFSFLPTYVSILFLYMIRIQIEKKGILYWTPSETIIHIYVTPVKTIDISE